LNAAKVAIEVSRFRRKPCEHISDAGIENSLTTTGTDIPPATEENLLYHLQMVGRKLFPRVLCVACSHRVFTGLTMALKGSRLQLLTAATRSQAVAFCVAHFVAAVVLDGESIRGPELSLAQALKAVRPILPIFLLEERKRLTADLPEGIDVAVALDAPEELRAAIESTLLRPSV
jgi:hypothetical protein